MVVAPPQKMGAFDQCADIVRLNGENRRQGVFGRFESVEHTQLVRELSLNPQSVWVERGRRLERRQRRDMIAVPPLAPSRLKQLFDGG